jgi:signal transduction histidine kinase
MKKIMLAFFMALSAVCLFGQAPNVDSLVNVLETQKLTSDEKFEIWYKLVKYYQIVDREKVIFYAQEGVDLAEKEHDALWGTRFNQVLGMFYYLHTGEYEKSINILKKSVDYAVEAKNKREENIANIYMGTVNSGASKYELALKYYTEVLPSLESEQQTEHYVNTLVNIAIIHQWMHNHDKELEYLERALPVAIKENNFRAEMFIYSSKGAVFYDAMKQADSAIVYVLKSYEMAKTISDKSQIVVCSQILAGIYAEQKEYEKAEKYAKECMDIANELGSKREIIASWAIMAKINFDLQRYKECDYYASKTWEADSTDLVLAENATAYLCWSNIFLNNQEKASYFFRKYAETRNQLSEKSLYESIADMEVKYETEKKELRIASLEKEKQLYIWLSIAGSAFLLAFIGVLFYRNRLKKQQIKQLEQEKQLIATQAVLDSETIERSKIARDLHDGLGGMLSVIKLNLNDMQNFSILEGQDMSRFGKAMDMLDESIGELRRIAHHMMPDSLIRFGLQVSLEEFCRAIPIANFQYLGEESRLDSRLEVMIYRCAYELINNAIKYAEASDINVQLLSDNGMVALNVQDNGKGFDPKQITSGSGLENIRTRVSAYNGKMYIYSAPGKGTEVNIEIESV